MELIILGTNTDDKGTQLESLTQFLLGELGYTDIVVNEIKAGGQEIDIRAERRFPSMGGEQTFRVICECKAHKTPIAMPDWLKFLGKVFVEETQLNRRVNGCLIALSGVNGNVAGSFDALCETGERIELITGDGLVRLLSRTFTIIPLPEVVDQETIKIVVELPDQEYECEPAKWKRDRSLRRTVLCDPGHKQATDSKYQRLDNLNRRILAGAKFIALIDDDV